MRRRPEPLPRPRRLRGDEDLTELALRALDGDREAESALVARTIDDVHRYCAHLVGPAAADDATQATYLRALRSLHRFRGESSLRTWLIGVARNTCLDERRSLARRIRIAERIAEQPHGRPGAAVPAITSIEIEELLGDLPPDRQEAFVLTQVLGFSYEDAAELIGCPIGTIRSRVARARRDLLHRWSDGDRSGAGSA